MALANYSDLQASVADWLNRTDLTTQIKDFITLVESQVNARLATSEMETSSSLTLDSNSEATLPTDYLKWRQVTAASNPKRPLDYVTPEYQDKAYGFRSSGSPSTFTIIGTTIRVLPKTTDTITLEYYQKVPALSDANTTNWLLTKQPGLYLNGAMLQASLFLKDMQGAQSWGSLYETEFLNLENADNTARYSRPKMRVSGPTP